MDLVLRASQLLERARWKEEGWDRPDPPDILRRWAEETDYHAVHMSEVGPGTTVRSPNDPDSDEEPPRREAGGFKAGVNPTTHYNTPVGVYGYPLNPDTYNRWFSGKRKPPFAASRDWMYLLEAPENDTLHIREDGNAGYTDKGFEKLAADITTGEPDMVRDAIENWDPMDPHASQDDLQLIDGTPGAIRNTTFLAEVEWDTRIATPFGKFWNFTRVVAQNGGNGASTWTHLLREYLYDDVVADHGSTIVHNNEPTQCVFLEPTNYEVVDVVPNVWDWKRRKKSSERQSHVYDELKYAGLGGLADDLEFTDMSSKLEVARGVQALEGEPWLHDMIGGAESPSDLDPWGDYGDGSAVSLSLENDPPEIEYGEFEELDLPTEMARDTPVRFNNCRFVECTFGPEYADAVGDEIVVISSEFINCTFAATEQRIAEAADEVGAGELTPDEVASKVTFYFIGGDPRGMAPDMIEDLVTDVWGVMAGIQFDDPYKQSEVEVV